MVFCAKADAAADLASFEAVFDISTLEAEVATLALVCSFEPFCVRADAATDFSNLVAVLLCMTFAAAEATLLPVLPPLLDTMTLISIFGVAKLGESGAQTQTKQWPDSLELKIERARTNVISLGNNWADQCRGEVWAGNRLPVWRPCVD